MSKANIDEIIKGYEEWNPEETNSEELAESLGISRPYLYQILRKHGVTTKSRQGVPTKKMLSLEQIEERLKTIEQGIEDILSKIG